MKNRFAVSRCCCGGDPPPDIYYPAGAYSGMSMKTVSGADPWRHGNPIDLAPSAFQTTDTYAGGFRSGTFTPRQYGHWGGWSFPVDRSSVTSAILHAHASGVFLANSGFVDSGATTCQRRTSPDVLARLYAITNRIDHIPDLMPLNPGSPPWTPDHAQYTYTAAVNVTLAVDTWLVQDVTSMVAAAMAHPDWVAGSHVTILLMPRSTEFIGTVITPVRSVWACDSLLIEEAGDFYSVPHAWLDVT